MSGRGQLLSVEASPREGRESLVQSPEIRGEIVAAHRLARDCLIVLGWSEGEIASEGSATITGSDAHHGRFRAASWSNAQASQEHWYVAAVRVPEIGTLKVGEGVLLQGAGSTAPRAVCLPPAISDGASFVAELRSRAGGYLAEAVRFLLETFSSRVSRQLEPVTVLLAAILDTASEEKGVVETLGLIDGEGLLLQGWLGLPFAGRQRLLVLGDVLEEHEAICANFPRPDLAGRGRGMLALVRPQGGVVTEAPQRIYLRAGNLFYRLNVLPNPTRLRGDEASNHVRAMMPTLVVDEEARRLLQIAVRPRYAGTDTVSSLDQPVRMAVDLAVCVIDVGWYITGWLLDPANLVSAVFLRGRDGLAERLDASWTRVPREDVTASFRSDPLFQGRVAHDLHGFTVFVPHRAAQGEAWLELQLGDDRSAFMPLRPVSGVGWAQRKQLLESFDIHKPSGRSIVELHLGPLFHAAKSAPKRTIDYRVLRARGAGSAAAEAALIIPIVEPGIRTKLVVSQLASRDPGAGIVPVFVCSNLTSEGTSALLREIAFYGLDAEVLLAAEPVDSCEAIDIGVQATTAPKLVFMSPSTYPLQACWATQLLAFLDDGAEPVVASPTLLYEDWSICYGGIDGLRFIEAAPFTDAASSRAGYPRAAMPEVGVTPTLAASLDCCALPRAAFKSADGFSSGYALARQNGLDLFLRMRQAGARMVWVPQVEAYTLSDAGVQSEYWRQMGELIDGWSLRASWQDSLPPTIDLVHISDMIDTGSSALASVRRSIVRDGVIIGAGESFGATGVGAA